MSHHERRRLRPGALLIGVILAACGAETAAVFVIAIANDWSVQNHPDRHYSLQPVGVAGDQQVNSADITGFEQVDVLQDAPLSGHYQGQNIHFTVSRPIADSGSGCDPSVNTCADAICQCAQVVFTGLIQDQHTIQVTSTGGAESYTLTR